MNENNVIHLEDREKSADPLSEMLKDGARNLIANAVGLELQELLKERTSTSQLAMLAQLFSIKFS